MATENKLIVRLPEDENEAFRLVAESYGMTKSELIREMVRAANEKTLRIITNKKTVRTIKGVHINA